MEYQIFDQNHSFISFYFIFIKNILIFSFINISALAASASSAAATAQPPYNRNQYNKEDVIPADQSVGLPNIGTFTLFKITSLLKNKEDLDNQLDKIEKILESYNLYNLIKKDVLQPYRDSENSQKQKTISKQVYTQLLGSIDNKLIQKLNSQDNKITFANEFVNKLKKLIKDKDYRALKIVITKFKTILRS